MNILNKKKEILNVDYDTILNAEKERNEFENLINQKKEKKLIFDDDDELLHFLNERQLVLDKARNKISELNTSIQEKINNGQIDVKE